MESTSVIGLRWKQIIENGKRLNGYGICPKCALSPTKLKQQKLTA